MTASRQRTETDTRAVYVIEEAFWGYAVRSTERAPASVVLAQALAWVVGAAAAAAAVAPWVMAVAGAPSTAGAGFQAVASIILSTLAFLLFRFASRGTMSELQIDLMQGEVREVLPHRAGRVTVLGRYGFDAIGGVFIDRARGSDRAVLVLRYRNTAQILPVAMGPERLLEPLRDRLGRDLVLRGQAAEPLAGVRATSAA